MTPAGVSPECGVPAQKVYLQAAVTEDVACQPAPLADQSLYQAEDHGPGVAGPKGHENPWDRIDEDCDQKAEFAAKPAEGKKKREGGSAAYRVVKVANQRVGRGWRWSLSPSSLLILNRNVYLLFPLQEFSSQWKLKGLLCPVFRSVLTSC